MRFYTLIFFVLAVGFYSCSKTEVLPEAIEEEPVLYLRGIMDSRSFEMQAGKNATFGSATVYKAVTSHDTLMSFSFRVDAVDDKKRPTYSFEVTVNNYNITTGKFDDDLNNTIQPGNYTYAKTDSFPNYGFVPKQVIILYSDHTIGHDYYTLPKSQMTKFKILNVRDEYRNGNHYKIAQVEFDIVVTRCVGNWVTNYSIPIKANGDVAFGME